MDERHARMSASHASASTTRVDADARDPLSDVLSATKLAGALFFQVDATSPWGVEIPPARLFASLILPRARHVISYHVVVHGSGWARVGGAPAVRFGSGDILVFPHGDPYALLSAPGVQPELDHASALDFFRAMAQRRLPFVVTEGGGGPERARFACGFLGCDTRPFNPLLGALPALMHIRRREGAADDLLDRLLELTLAEGRIRRAGGECIRLRLSELMFVEVVRRYLEALAPGETGWLAGLRDPGIARALALLHERPDHAWTLEELARDVAMSRSALADRFARLVGLAPMHYLAHWRMQLAARLLTDGTTKVAAVALAVGYASEAAFSRTFKKLCGLAPGAWRRRCATGLREDTARVEEAR
jgi:AraC-like DNA-binding protein